MGKPSGSERVVEEETLGIKSLKEKMLGVVLGFAPETSIPERRQAFFIVSTLKASARASM